MIVGLFDRWQSPEEENVTVRRVNRDLIHGKTVVAEVVDRPTHAQLVLVSENRRFALGFEVDRTALAQLERHIPVQQVMSRAGVGLLVREVVQGPGYTRLVYEPRSITRPRNSGSKPTGRCGWRPICGCRCGRGPKSP